eukprot:m.206499 g.206499  ORF g.206499 m.206499 type:complete len:117 (+) comp15027_c0_seq1:86-436(+)
MATYRARHILVKHEESRRCSSWKDEEGKDIRARSVDAATAMLEKFRADILSGAKTFEEIASVESDCGSAAQGGDIGEFVEQDLQKPFFDAVVALKVGELSPVVYTDSGAHIIERLA